MKRVLFILAAVTAASCSPREAATPETAPEPALAAPGPSTVRGIHHIKLSITDLDRSLAFYQGATQFTLVDRSDLEPSAALDEAAGKAGIGGERALLRGPNGQIELVDFDDEETASYPIVPVNGPGIVHICFQSPKDRPLYERFRERGTHPVTRGGEPVDMLGRDYYYMYSRDADGLLFEVEHASAPRFDGDIWFEHVAFGTHDLDRLAAFYTALVGEEPYQISRDISGPTFDQVAGLDDVNMDGGWILTDNMRIEMWQYNNPPTAPAPAPRPLTAPGYAAVVFEVGDIANDLRRIEDAGGSIVSQIEGDDAQRTAYARDPDGNLIGLVQFEEGSAHSMDQLQHPTRDPN